MIFTRYMDDTGMVTGSGWICGEDASNLKCDGQAVLEGIEYQGGWIDGSVHFSQPPSPSRNHIFNWQTKQWQDPRTLQDLKDARWQSIKQLRTAAEFATFTYNGMEFDGDLNAQRRLGSYISVSKGALAAGTPFSAEFILADNALVTLTAQDFVAIEMVKVAAVAEAFAHAAALRAQIEAAETPEAVALVAW
jgi:hypothetical protein